MKQRIDRCIYFYIKMVSDFRLRISTTQKWGRSRNERHTRNKFLESGSGPFEAGDFSRVRGNS